MFEYSELPQVNIVVLLQTCHPDRTCLAVQQTENTLGMPSRCGQRVLAYCWMYWPTEGADVGALKCARVNHVLTEAQVSSASRNATT